MVTRFALTSFFVGLFLPVGMAVASPISDEELFDQLNIDFRSGDLWSECIYRSGCGQSTAGSPASVAVSTSLTSKLFWDERDGFGVFGGEHDEIDADESLTIAFGGDTAFALSAIAFADMYLTPKGDGSGESAAIEFYLDGEQVGPDGGMTFTQTEDRENGVALFSLDAVLTVDEIVFRAVDGTNHEFSVAGLAGVSAMVESGGEALVPPESAPDLVLPPDQDRPATRPAIATPVPASVFLFIGGLIGLLGVGGVCRRR